MYMSYEECTFCQYREGISCCRGENACPEESEDKDELGRENE